MAGRLLNQQGVVQAMAVATEEAQPWGNALKTGGGASSTSLAAATATSEWSSQSTLLVPCQEQRCKGSLHLQATPQWVKEQPTSPRTASKQVIPPGYLLTRLFERCKRHCLPLSMVGHLNGGREIERGLETVFSKAPFDIGHTRRALDA